MIPFTFVRQRTSGRDEQTSDSCAPYHCSWTNTFRIRELSWVVMTAWQELQEKRQLVPLVARCCSAWVKKKMFRWIVRQSVRETCSCTTCADWRRGIEWDGYQIDGQIFLSVKFMIVFTRMLVRCIFQCPSYFLFIWSSWTSDLSAWYCRGAGKRIHPDVSTQWSRATYHL